MEKRLLHMERLRVNTAARMATSKVARVFVFFAVSSALGRAKKFIPPQQTEQVSFLGVGHHGDGYEECKEPASEGDEVGAERAV
jgi:hypothetical protein